MGEQVPRRKGLIRRAIGGLASPLGAVLLLGIGIGWASLGALHWTFQATSTQGFCISCHEMHDNVYAETIGTPHHANASGVAAGCSDCHIPKAFWPKMVRKVESARELYGHFVLGVIDTPEEYEAHRLDMAMRVWHDMKANDSAECRACHDFEAMDPQAQSAAAAASHKMAAGAGMTCIDCHQGLAHDLPEGWRDSYSEVARTIAGGE